MSTPQHPQERREGAEPGVRVDESGDQLSDDRDSVSRQRAVVETFLK